MKYSIALVASAAFAVAQTIPDTINECGRMCISNVAGQASTFGCTGPSDAACLCSDPRFGYGLRDCAAEACGAEVLAAVQAYVGTFCPAAGVTSGGAATAVSTGASGLTASSTAISTEAVVSTISSGGSAVATSTIGSTTLFSIIGAAAGVTGSLSGAASDAAASASGALSSLASSASDAASSLGAAASSAGGSVSSAAGSATSAASSAIASASAAGSSAAASATSSGLAPMMTAGPIFGAVAGLAGLLLI